MAGIINPVARFAAWKGHRNDYLKDTAQYLLDTPADVFYILPHKNEVLITVYFVPWLVVALRS